MNHTSGKEMLASRLVYYRSRASGVDDSTPTDSEELSRHRTLAQPIWMLHSSYWVTKALPSSNPQIGLHLVGKSAVGNI
jgi:hypothetical protein